MFSMQWLNPLIATFQLSSAASLNLVRSQNGVLGNYSVALKGRIPYQTTKLSFIADKLNVNQMVAIVINGMKYCMGKGENANNQKKKKIVPFSTMCPTFFLRQDL